MKNSRVPFYGLILVLMAAGIALTWYRHSYFDVPWVPGEKQTIWSIEAKVQFSGLNESVKASLAVPDSQPGFELVQEYTASPGYGFTFVEKGAEKGYARRAEWSKRKARGEQILYYRADVLVKPDVEKSVSTDIPSLNKKLVGESPQIASARDMLASANGRSADNFTLARELIVEFNQQQEQSSLLEQTESRGSWLVSLLHEANVPARLVSVLHLEDGRRRQLLKNYLQVFTAEDYELFDLQSGDQGISQNSMLWEYHSSPLLDIVGGEASAVSFSIIAQDVPASVRLQQISDTGSAYLDFSIHSLPLSEQALFKGILLIPIGVLVVCLLRVFVGIRTSGTFMPVLIAISFIQTSLITGLVGFFIIVGVGLVIRSYLSQLNLLLVSRISAVIISVIILIAIFAVIAYQLGLSEGLKITFFPMIILSWTIERMSILWEEEGPREVFVQVGGSLLVSLVAYSLMVNDLVRHLTFNFLGLQMIFMACVLLLGSYTGYRLLELRRFGPLVKTSD